ncbi:lipoprotein [Spiroplasma floricola]|uniref:Lipoprotein n=1 Tax=Spiroplasma floricola 23-6 TaxID=1336749 RepID=A0A2K8SE90_9MOLU|nr:lipoprotein [Spiroplasma floricola]AUB31759.1 hypothetical protein SFLOR_v1c07110 [Spiroplasma floricola 23-6]
MKKLLSILSVFAITSSATVTVVACGTKTESKNENKPEEPKKDITKIVQDFEQEVSKIWSQHYEKEVAANLIGVESMEESNEFLNKYNIQKFSKPENKDKLTNENKKQLTNDVEKLFKVKLLEEKLNELKKVNKYKIILDEVDSVFENVELVFNDNFQIKSGEIVSGSYIGNVIVDYKVVTKYKGLADVEKFKQSGTLKYTSTESESFKKVGDVMYKNIAKDMFISKDTEKYVNLKWNNIKENKNDSDAYVGSNSQLKKYYNENNEFHEVLLKTINDKYFKQEFSSMEISYDKKSIYKTDDFAIQNKDYLVINNLNQSDNDIIGFDMRNAEQYKKFQKIIAQDEQESKSFLVDQFNYSNWSKIRSNYKIAQDTFLNNFLNKNEISEYQKTDNYKLAIAMGYIDFIGPSIKIGKEESSYNHQMPDFKLAISYSMNGITDQNYKSIIDFSLKLFNVYQNTYEINLKNIRYSATSVYFKKTKIWQEKEIKGANNLKINSALTDFKDIYYANLKESLDKKSLNNNMFKEKYIHFSIKNVDVNLVNNQVWINNRNNESFFRVNIDDESSSNFLKTPFQNFDYMTLNLFGIIKIKLKFDRSYIVNEWSIIF